MLGGGFVNQVVQEAFAQQGYWVEFRFMPWQRGKREALKGRVEAASYWQCNAEVSKSFLCSDALKREQYVLFYRKVNPLPDWQELADLRGLRIGATAGYSYSEAFWQATESGVLTVELVQEDEQNIGKLLKGRIDALLLDPVVAYDLLARHFAPGAGHLLEFNPRPVAEMTGHLLISRKSPRAEELLRAFNVGLQALHDNGRYEQLWDGLLQGAYSEPTQPASKASPTNVQ
nr:transporter substrate-binding domain-containing protein [Atopomonas sediminilitoris]